MVQVTQTDSTVLIRCSLISSLSVIVPWSSIIYSSSIRRLHVVHTLPLLLPDKCTTVEFSETILHIAVSREQIRTPGPNVSEVSATTKDPQGLVQQAHSIKSLQFAAGAWHLSLIVWKDRHRYDAEAETEEG